MISISTRLEEENLKKIENLAKKLNLSRGALIRKFILDGYQEATLIENINFVHEGVLSTEKAAKNAGVSIYHLLERARAMNLEIGLDESTLKYEFKSLMKTLNENNS
ncbi:MAG: ribbon-helix-helix protein, CopG family [Promethearchaeota archaeon]